MKAQLDASKYDISQMRERLAERDRAIAQLRAAGHCDAMAPLSIVRTVDELCEVDESSLPKYECLLQVGKKNHSFFH